MAPFYTLSMGMSADLEVAVQAVQPLPPLQNPSKLIAPSYRFYPDTTTEQAQIEAAMKTYGVRPVKLVSLSS